jgi:hypothetical protein
MPFGRHSGYTFSTVSIQRNAPACSGVYGLSNAQEWILVGTADNIQAALLSHLRERETVFSSRRATGFTFEPCDPGSRAERQSRLIAEFDPVCNHQQR